MMQSFLDSIWTVIQSYTDMLKNTSIANYMFGGVSLWKILIGLFCCLILLRSVLNPTGGGNLLRRFHGGDRPPEEK